MKVLYDNLVFEDVAFGGVPRYFTEIIRHFPTDVKAMISVIETDNVYLNAEPFSIPTTGWCYRRFLPGTRFKGKRILYKFLSHLIAPFLPSCEIKNGNRFRNLLLGGDFDILHLTRAHFYGNNWRPIAGKKPIVVTIHDLIPEKLQGLERVRKERKRIIPFATRFIAVSEYTKSEFVAEYNIDPNLVDVIYHGPFTETRESAPVVFDQERNGYILFVGGRTSYKNFSFFAKAIAPWLRARPKMRLVCTGSPFSKTEQELLRNLHLLRQADARFYSTEDLPALYEKAFAFVFPSRCEGFGIPILDAFAADCPVILSRASCFPEIGGDAALYFNPDDETDLIRQLNRLETDPLTRRSLVEKGRKRVALFSWEKAARETANCYKKAIAEFADRNNSFQN